MFPLYKAEITYVDSGIEYRKVIEDVDMTMFYARIVGSIEGIVTWAHVTNLVVSDPHAKIRSNERKRNDQLLHL